MARNGSIPGTAWICALTLGAFGLSACGGGGDRPASPTPTGGAATTAAAPKPVWSACRGLPETPPADPDRATPKGPAPECATLKVPLDYDDPGGETIDLALIRYRAAGPGARIGSLVFNFGGPGGSGVEGLAQSVSLYRTLNTRYDLVSFDPRGVGRSAPVTCLDDRAMDRMTAMDSSPDDAAEEKALVDADKAFEQSCRARAGKLLPHVGTLNAARDMDRLRAALGDPKLAYFGISYGTWLGGNYAHQTPGNLGRAVLDGAVDTKISSIDLGLQQTAAFQKALGNFAADCAAKRCALGRDAAAVTKAVADLVDRLDRAPLPGENGRALTQALGLTGVTTALYDKEYWPILVQALTLAIDDGQGAALLTLADAMNDRGDDGRYGTLIPAHTAIGCADTTERFTVEDVRRELPRFRNASPIFGPTAAWGLLSCLDWPYGGDDAAKEVSAPDAPPTVVVGNVGDPATPYAWAPALAREIGPKARLLTLKGEGHGAYNTGDACVQRHVDRYLLEGVVPAEGTVCD